jgi:hypothetical protein
MSATPEGFVIERCRTETCNAEIVWARTETGKLMPVDAEPSGVGNVRVFAVQGIVCARVVSAEDAERMRRDPLAVPLRTSHFVTCQRAADWREPR